MSRSPNLLFSLVLDTLSNKPLLSETQSNLLKDLDQKLKDEGSSVHNLQKQLQTTIDHGKGLGILLVENEEVRMPFLLKGTKTFEWTRFNDNPVPEEEPRSQSVPPEKSNSKDVSVTTPKTPQKPEKTASRTRSTHRSRSRRSRRARRSRRRRRQ